MALSSIRAPLVFAAEVPDTQLCSFCLKSPFIGAAFLICRPLSNSVAAALRCSSEWPTNQPLALAKPPPGARCSAAELTPRRCRALVARAEGREASAVEPRRSSARAGAAGHRRRRTETCSFVCSCQGEVASWLHTRVLQQLVLLRPLKYLLSFFIKSILKYSF